MALQVDGSSPAAVVGSGATTVTASFTPPNNSRLVAFVDADANNGSTTEQGTVTSTGGVSWSLAGRHNGGVGALAEVWVSSALDVSPGSITASVADNQGSVAKRLFVRVITDTNGFTPAGIGAVTTGTGASLNYTSTVNDSWGWSTGLGSGTPVAGSGQTLQDSDAAFDGGDTVWTLAQNATTATAGSTVTMNVTNSGIQHVAVEILPGVAGVIADLGGRVSVGFHPGRGPTAARFYQTPRPYDLTSTQITADTGLAELGVVATAAAMKVAVVTAATTLGVVASGAGKKVSTDTGQANVGLSANAIHVQISADTGLAELGLAATAATVKVAKVTGVASVGLSATGTVRKVSKDTGTAAAGLSSADTAAKVSKDTGTAALGLSANAVRVPIRAETGTATLGVAAQVATKKIVVASAVASVGVASSATARKVAKASQAAALGVCSIGTARKVSKDTGAAYAGVVARFAGIDLRAVTARSVLALRAQQHQCTTYRSNIGTTTRPAGTTARPFTGTTSKPC